jgi:P pilus assembly chaperone PapD
MSVGKKIAWWLAALAILVFLPGFEAKAQTAGLGLDPGRIEIAMKPGQEKTIGFTIDSPFSEVSVRGRLLLSLTDWNINEDTSIIYAEAGSMKNSASSWVVFSPAAVTISSGQKQLVRVTVRVPAQTAPGLYRTAIFVQERPPASPPQNGEQLVYIRFRYVFFLYVIVPPVSVQPEVTDLRLITAPDGLRLVCEMTNQGSRHVRPLISISIHNSHKDEIKLVGNYEATVLLPFSTIREAFHLNEELAPDMYEISAQVDFQDDGPLHSIHRTVDWNPSRETHAPEKATAED